MMRRLLPFVQSMEDVQFTALEQRNYMIIKSVADNIHPAMISNVLRRYHQTDI